MSFSADNSHFSFSSSLEPNHLESLGNDDEIIEDEEDLFGDGGNHEDEYPRSCGLEDDIDIDDGEEDFAWIGDGGSPEDEFFDSVVGALEEILMDDEFIDMQTCFMMENCHEFENSEENKLIYMDIYSKYTNLIEKYIEDRLAQDIPNFSMNEFLSMLEDREEEVSGDVFEMLVSFADFSTFKELILSYQSKDRSSMSTCVSEFEEEPSSSSRSPSSFSDFLCASPVSKTSGFRIDPA